MAMKHCSKCFEVLPMNKYHFISQKKNVSGLGASCRGCAKDWRAANIEHLKEYNRNYQLENKDTLKAYRSDYYKKNKEKYKIAHKKRYDNNKKEILEYQKIYYKKNRSKVLQYHEQYYKRNKTHKKHYDSNYRENNKEKVRYWGRLSSHKRRAAYHSLKSSLTFKQWKQALSHFNHQCAYCGSTESLEQEHVIPVSRGGHYTPDNIIPACRSCNASKNNKIMQDWFTQHENYSVERMANILKYVQKNKTEVNI